MACTEIEGFHGYAVLPALLLEGALLHNTESYEEATNFFASSYYNIK